MGTLCVLEADRFSSTGTYRLDETRYGVSGNTGELVSYDNHFTGESSDWSNTQTITINGNAPTTTLTTTPSQYPTATPDAQGDANQQGFNWAEISLFAALGVIVALLVYCAYA